MEFGTIAINDLPSHTLDSSALLADLRSPAEYRRSHIPEAINLPFEQWQDNPSLLQEYRNRTLYLYCEFGNISLLAARVLTDAGFQVYNLYGGIHSYRGPRTRQNNPARKTLLDVDSDSVYNKQGKGGFRKSKSQPCCRKENGESPDD